MRIAYVTIHVAPQIMQGGAGKKIKSQMRIWREHGHEVALFSLTPAEIPFPEEHQFIFESRGDLFRREINRASTLKRMLAVIRQFNPELIYLRYGLYSYPLHRIFKIAPVVLETNSDDVQEYRKRGAFFYWMNRLTRKLTIAPAKGLIVPSHELVNILLPNHDKPNRVISNGIDLKDVEPLPPTKNEKPVITLVGSPGMNWHGVDKLIKLAEACPEIFVNIVGYSQKDIGQPVPQNVRLHGFLDKQGVREVLMKTDVACGSLALHRNKMEEASVLKIREALAHGIPVIIAYRDTDLNELSLDTILRIPNTENNVLENAAKIHEFALGMIGRRVDIKTVAPLLDQGQKELTRLAFFQKILDAK
ncbi:MAG: glycosyltransferase family 4 protein [Anaerolineales bacterium]|nr:glycosyltransferase family 4 protein [Anaerolineales bacterium]